MKASKPDNWGKDGPLCEVLCSAKSDEPASDSVHRLRGRLVQAGVAVGIAAASEGIAAAVQGAAAVKGSISLGLGIKIAVPIATVAAVAFAVVRSPWVEDKEDISAVEAVSVGRPEKTGGRDAPRLAAPQTPAPAEDTSPPDTAAPAPFLQKENTADPPKPNRRKTATVSKTEPAESARDLDERSTEPIASPSRIAEEVKLIDEARRALSFNPQRALELTKAHRTSFSDGLLCTERDLIAVNALFRLHRTADACAAAALFIQNNPSSAHVSRLKKLCDKSPR